MLLPTLPTKRSLRLYFFLASLILALPFHAWSQAEVVDCLKNAVTPDQIKTCQDAAESVRKLRSNLSIGQDIASKYKKGGEKWDGDRYEEHEWYDGNPNFLEAWMMEDTEAIMKDFVGCFDFRILGMCAPCYILVEFHWPEVVGETNNFGIGAFLAGQLRPAMVSAKEAMMPPLLGGIKTKDGDKAEFPDGLREDEHLGQSHVDDTGWSPGQHVRNYEAHIYRSFFDWLLAIMDIPCWSGCLPPVDRFTLQWSEMVSPLWRIPELSFIRLMDNDKYTDMYAQLPVLALTPGWLYHGLSLSPLPVPRTEGPKINSLALSTCASYRAAKMGNLIPLEMKGKILPMEIGDMEKLCYHQSVGQLYPLTGDIEANAETTSPIGAVRRIFEWGSMDLWTNHLRSNYYNDWKGENLFRIPPADYKTESGSRRADKLQRLVPEASECYQMKDIDERDNDRWPKGMIKEEDLGDRREVHWNRRRCCINVCVCHEITIEE